MIVGVYRAAQRLYPRRFRAEYGDDMVSLLREQLRDESAWRVSGRAVVDLAVSVPIQYVEVYMSRSRASLFVLAATLVAATATFAFLEGLVGITIAVVGVTLATLIWRRERPVHERQGMIERWWLLLMGGAALLAIAIGAATASGELSDPAWVATMLGVLGGVALAGAGVVLGLLKVADRRSAPGVTA